MKKKKMFKLKIPEINEMKKKERMDLIVKSYIISKKIYIKKAR